MRNTEPDFLVYKGQRRLSNVVLPTNFLKLRLYLTINIRDGLLIPQILFICGPREQVQILPPPYFSQVLGEPLPLLKFPQVKSQVYL